MNKRIKFKEKLLSYLEAQGRKIRNSIYQKKLENRDFSIISNNCNGGVMAHDLGVKFNTPFINAGFLPDDYIKLLKNLKFYVNECDLEFITPKIDGHYIITGQENYPVALLGDITVYFPHDHSEEDVLDNWNRRKNRINWDNLFVVFTERDGCTYDNIAEFDQLPYEHKVIFTYKKYPEFKSAFYIHGFENQKMVGICTNYYGCFGKRYLDQFDYVKWLNNGK